MKGLFLSLGICMMMPLCGEVTWAPAQTISDVGNINQVEIGVSCVQEKKGIAVWSIGSAPNLEIQAATFDGEWQEPITISE